MSVEFPIEGHTEKFFKKYSGEELTKETDWRAILNQMEQAGQIVIDTTTPLDSTPELYQVKLSLTEKGAQDLLGSSEEYRERFEVLQAEFRNKLGPLMAKKFEDLPEAVQVRLKKMVAFLDTLSPTQIAVSEDLQNIYESEMVRTLRVSIRQVFEGND